MGGVLLFSGRPNPTWHVSEDTVVELMLIWENLPPIKREPVFLPKLGYQGCFLKCTNNKEWIVLDNVVMYKRIEEIKYRRDKEGRFKKVLLSTVPKDIFSFI